MKKLALCAVGYVLLLALLYLLVSLDPLGPAVYLKTALIITPLYLTMCLLVNAHRNTRQQHTR
jgi:hypothetical protein